MALGNQQPDSTSSTGDPGRSAAQMKGDAQATGALVSPEVRSGIAAQLEQARRDLLDLGMRNPLLNYRLRKGRGLRVVSPNAQEVFSCLVLEEKTLTFFPAADENEPASEVSAEPEQSTTDLSVDATDAVTEQGVPSRRSTAVRVHTSHSKEELQRRLVSTYRLARIAMEEQGVNVLFVALGMLTWYESESSQECRSAPLVLVPISLERSVRRTTFRARYTGDDVGVNLSLLAKLRAEFGIELPEDSQLETAEDLQTYFDEVRHTVAEYTRWSVDSNAVAIGFFSFAKFLMFHDLDPQTCVSEEAGPGSTLLYALLGEGFSTLPEDAVDEARLDKLLHPQEILQVYDADSTQTAAILDAKRAPCLVVQGPPGTGKSQTITNLIAEAVGAGSTVLFVAEKKAALEVVRRRLANAGLGDISLELYSNKANKRAVLEELKRTLDLGQPRRLAAVESISELISHRDRLNAYCEAMNTPVGRSFTTPYEALGHHLRLASRVDTGSLPQAVRDLCTDEWTREEFRERRSLVKDVEHLLRQMGDPRANPFWGSQKQVYLLTDRHEVAKIAETAKSALIRLMEQCDRLSGAIGGQPIASLSALDQSLAIAGALGSQPRLDGIALHHDAWTGQGDRILSLLSMAEWLQATRAKHAHELTPEAWQRDLTSLHRVLAHVGQRWYRFLVPSYREAVRELRGLFVSQCPASARDQLRVVKDLMRAQVVEEELRRAEPLLRELFGPQWRGGRADVTGLAGASQWLVQLHKAIMAGELPHDVLDALERTNDTAPIRATQDQVRELRDTYLAALDRVIVAAFLPEGAADDRFVHVLRQQPFALQQARLRSWKEHPEALREVADYNRYMSRLAQEGLQTWVEFVSAWNPQDGALADLLTFAWYNSVLNRSFREREVLARFRGTQHDAVVEAFRDLDRELLRVNRSRVALVHWEGCQRARTMATSGQVGILRQEFEKKRRHLPIRKLLGKAGSAVQQIKPVFMMSPLSVAALIPKGTLQFDLVIFDEASQVRPVDAFGSILRGKKAIVIGDKKQLPPTTFFDKLYELDGDEEDSEAPADMESILGMFCAKRAPERMLRWHYRSRHHSLIAVSNQEFYDDKLVVFPSPAHLADGLGLVLRPLPDTVYEPGARKAHNPKEAEAVARAVMQHGRDFPDLTLGVVAFSQSQAHLIEDYVERERRRGDSPEGFFNGHPEEPFFVKNLENVQGDERDVIFISVGYGKQQSGKLSMNFGPLNHEGGERRLNVLITRARHRCEVFCNFRADDLLLEKSEARGVVALKRYLKYAETRELELAKASDREPDSPFEEEVAECIREAGYQVHHQVGSGGYFIDLGVVDPAQPGRYLMGVECDGASYHSAKWARDRDRLRQAVLEDRGWCIHRIWSTDWFNAPDREARRLIEAIQTAGCADAPPKGIDPGVSGSGSGGKRQITDSIPLHENPGSDDVRREADDAPPPQAVIARAYCRADLSPIEVELRAVGNDLHVVSPHSMTNWIQVVARTESPIHVRVIAKRLREGAGLQRTGSRIVASVERSIRFASARGLLERRDDFVWTQYTPESEPRGRSDMPSDERAIDLIAPEEIAGAIVMVVRASLGLERADLVSEVVRLFGFGRTSPDMENAIGKVIKRMCSSHRLVQRGIYLHIAS